MTTIKSYTDINQSKKLAEILPLESADMCFANDGTAIKIDANPYTVRYSMWKDCVVEVIPCWSLAALFDVLPGGYVIVKNYHSFYYVESRDHSKSTNIFDNPVDACVAMIEQLHKLNLL